MLKSFKHDDVKIYLIHLRKFGLGDLCNRAVSMIHEVNVQMLEKILFLSLFFKLMEFHNFNLFYLLFSLYNILVNCYSLILL